jgi:hypothetical protein
MQTRSYFACANPSTADCLQNLNACHWLGITPVPFTAACPYSIAATFTVLKHACKPAVRFYTPFEHPFETAVTSSFVASLASRTGDSFTISKNTRKFERRVEYCIGVTAMGVAEWK